MKAKPKKQTIGLAVSAKRSRPAGPSVASIGNVNESELLADLRILIQAARQRVATVANSAHTMIYWHVGRRILRENLLEGRGAF